MLRIKHHYDDLQSLLQLREDMVKMVVHDLRNPLAGILLGLELLKSIDYPREKQQTKLATLDYCAQEIQVLIDDLLQISLLEFGKNCLNYTEVYLCDFVKSALSNFEALAAKKNQSLVAQLPE
jgi:signal transduction histidine kinase